MSSERRPIRILYSFPDKLDLSGDSLDLIAWQQVNGLARLGVEVVVYCASCVTPLAHPATVRQTLGLGRLRVPHRLLGSGRAHLFHDRQVSKALPRLAGTIDVVHCWPSGALRTLQAARRLGIPTFLERPNTHTRAALDVVAQECEKLGLRLPISHSHARNDDRLVHEEAEFALADRLLCPSEHVAQSFLARGFGEERIARHQYGYDPARFFQEAPAGRDSARFSAVFVGRCEPRKGLHYALRAWFDSGAHERGKLYICGRFVPGYRELLAEQMNHSSIEFLGYTDVAQVMRRCDVLLLPSVEEGSALVTYEARASGCVLLVSDHTGARCVHGHNGLVHPAGDVTALTQDLRRVSHEPEVLERLRTASLAELRDLSWSSAAASLLAAYKAEVRSRPLTELTGSDKCPPGTVAMPTG